MNLYSIKRRNCRTFRPQGSWWRPLGSKRSTTILLLSWLNELLKIRLYLRNKDDVLPKQWGVPSANTCAVQKAITHICIQTIICLSSSNPCSPIQECKLNISLGVSFSFLHICSEVSHKHTESTQFTHSTQSNTHMHESTHTYIHTNESPLTHTHSTPGQAI